MHTFYGYFHNSFDLYTLSYDFLGLKSMQNICDDKRPVGYTGNKIFFQTSSINLDSLTEVFIHLHKYISHV